jgi:DNA repair protein RecN (Recombination protein N)
MLEKLSIRNIVLINKLDLTFEKGLCVLTGETGAGKSILLDSLALALGARADASLIRSGQGEGTVTAEFSLAPAHPVYALVEELDVNPGEALILWRKIGKDGRSKASLNDQSISAGLLRKIGDTLVEIHGQNAERGLLDASGHRGLLDQYGQLQQECKQVSGLYEKMQIAGAELAKATQAIENARIDEEYLQHMVQELSDLAPEQGEEDRLSEERSQLMHAEKIAEALKDAEKSLTEHGGIENKLRSATRAIERVLDKAPEKLDPVLRSLEKAAMEMSEAQNVINMVGLDLNMDPAGLEIVEERLFALRAAARKHKCTVEELPSLLEQFKHKLQAVVDSDLELKKLRIKAKETREAFVLMADTLSAKRKDVAIKMDEAVKKELAPLKLSNASFITKITNLEENQWNSTGSNKVEFLISTNSGAEAGSLIKIASGGELSRFMLALKVVLAKSGSAPTLVFDEVDRGVGGATAGAVGDRLKRLAEKLQVLVVTHSPQVAASGEAHWNIHKVNEKTGTTTSVQRLSSDQRQEEIARMLSGATITNEARAAARSLIQG